MWLCVGCVCGAVRCCGLVCFVAPFCCACVGVFVVSSVCVVCCVVFCCCVVVLLCGVLFGCDDG